MKGPRPIGDANKPRRIAGVSAPPGWLHRVCFEEGVEALLLFDIETRAVIDANKTAERLTGYSREELLDLRLDDLHPRSSHEKAIRYFRKIASQSSYTYDDLSLETKDQTRIPVEVKGARITFGGGRIVQTNFRDISKERLLQQEVLFHSLKLTVLNSLSSAISSSLELTKILSNALAAVMEASGGLYGEMLLWLKDRTAFKIISYQGSKDLAGLPDLPDLPEKTAASPGNVRYFHQALDRELKLVARHRSRLSLIFLDLDRFKLINDTHGHLRGSRVLRAVEFLLRAAVRETDIAARYGGDEFVVILPDTDLALARRLGERIRKIICHHIFLRDEGLNERLGASIGVATYPSEAHTKEELIQLADERMCRDKKKNRDLGRR